jgi:hypothetical protein
MLEKIKGVNKKENKKRNEKDRQHLTKNQFATPIS